MNENNPLEPVHVHVAEGGPKENATKIWISSTGKCILCHNRSRIPEHELNKIMRMIEAMSEDIVGKWKDYFGEAVFYC